jgi:hypothetical protein
MIKSAGCGGWHTGTNDETRREVKQGDRVFTKGDYEPGVVVEYMGDFDFPKVRVLMDGQTDPVTYYADSLLTIPEPPDLETVLTIAENSESYEAIMLAAEVRRLRKAVRQEGHDGWEQGMADAKLQALGIRPLVRNPYLED